MYTLEEKAIHTVFLAFAGMKRIKEDIDLSFHSISVGMMLKNLNVSEEVLISGYLHDLIEDTSLDYEYIKNNFSLAIANNVMALSEDVRIADWYERKNEFFERISKSSKDIILIELADKLHNLLSDYDAFIMSGNDALCTLNTTYEMNKWYYLKFKELFKSVLNSNELLDRYNLIVSKYFD